MHLYFALFNSTASMLIRFYDLVNSSFRLFANPIFFNRLKNAKRKRITTIRLQGKFNIFVHGAPVAICLQILNRCGLTAELERDLSSKLFSSIWRQCINIFQRIQWRPYFGTLSAQGVEFSPATLQFKLSFGMNTLD